LRRLKLDLCNNGLQLIGTGLELLHLVLRQLVEDLAPGAAAGQLLLNLLCPQSNIHTHSPADPRRRLPQTRCPEKRQLKWAL